MKLLITPAGGGGYDTIQDEGVAQTKRTTMNFIGAGVTASDVGGLTQINIPGGAGATTGQATIDFGTKEDGNASVTVSTTSALTASKIFVTPAGVATADHDSPDDYAVEGVTFGVGNIVNGVSFDLFASAPNGTFGQYVANWAIF